MTSTQTTEAAITTTQPPLIPGSDIQCDQLFDVIFVMDSSRSINAPQYVREKDFVKELATILNVGAGTRAAVIIYSDDTQLEIRFDTKWKRGGVVLYVLHQCGRRLIGSEIRRLKVEWRLISASVAFRFRVRHALLLHIGSDPSISMCNFSGQASHPKRRLRGGGKCCTYATRPRPKHHP